MIRSKEHPWPFFVLLIVFVFAMTSCSFLGGDVKKDDKVEKLPEGKTITVKEMKTYEGVASTKPKASPEEKTVLSVPPETQTPAPSKLEAEAKTIIQEPEIKSAPSTPPPPPPPPTEKAVPALEEPKAKPVAPEAEIKAAPAAPPMSPPAPKKAVTALKEPPAAPVAADAPSTAETEAKITPMPIPERSSSPALQMRFKKRVGILDFENHSGYQQGKIGEEVARNLDNRLSATRQVIVLDQNTIMDMLTREGFKFGKLSDPAVMKHAYPSLGIQAFVLGTVTEVKLLSSRVSETSPGEVFSANVTTEIRLFDASTGNLLKTFTGKSLLSGAKPSGEYNKETAVLKATELSLDDVMGRFLQQLEMFDWTTTLARVEGNRLYLNAGKWSGLQVGDTLEVFEPGKEIFHTTTKLSMGWTTGRQKGTVRIDELFGVDASTGRVLQGSGFAPGDVLKPR